MQRSRCVDEREYRGMDSLKQARAEQLADLPPPRASAVESRALFDLYKIGGIGDVTPVLHHILLTCCLLMFRNSEYGCSSRARSDQLVHVTFESCPACASPHSRPHHLSAHLLPLANHPPPDDAAGVHWQSAGGRNSNGSYASLVHTTAV
jgi:hypothetical protein